jgi:septal ring factor EnvC (AmiA/AmiB activator)
MADDKHLEDRIKSLEHQVETLKHALGSFAVGLDKVSQIQANHTGAIEELTQASAAQVKYLKKLDGNTNKTNRLLSDVLNKLLPK